MRLTKSLLSDKHTHLLPAFLAAVLFLSCSPAFAVQEQDLAVSYGRALHEYYSGAYSSSEQTLTSVIDAGSHDPRAYYFRAMSRLRLGMSDAAVTDMKVGAALEARNPGLKSQISRSLQRVQGHDRQALERYRREARVSFASERRVKSRARYEGLERREGIVLRKPQDVPLESLLEAETAPAAVVPTAPASPAPVETVQPEPTEDDADDLFGPGPGASQPAEQAQPAEAASDGFDDLFGTPEETPVPAEPVQPEPVEDSTDDLFGPSEPAEPESAPAEDDPFGESNPESGSDDLFGESTDSEMAEDDSEDLFGESPASDDPFGEPAADQPGAADDLFGEEPSGSEADASAEPPAAGVSPDSQVESGKLFGILGRVLGKASPLSGVQAPSIDFGPPGFGGPQGDAGFGPMEEPGEDAFDFGPSALEEEAAMEESADDAFGGEEPAEEMAPDEDPFGGSEDDPFGGEDDPFGDDPFGEDAETDSGAEDTGTDTESDTTEETMEEEDDPFGGF